MSDASRNNAPTAEMRSPRARAEASTARHAVALRDLSDLSKIEVAGPGAPEFLARAQCNTPPRAVGEIRLTYLIDAQGIIHAEALLTRLPDAADGPLFYLTSDAPADALADWLRDQRRAGEAVRLDDVSTTRVGARLTGPYCGIILSAITLAPLTTDVFPWFVARVLSAAGHEDVRTLRLSQAGELGYELHAATPDGAEQILSDLAGVSIPLGVARPGPAVYDALRLEKARRSAREFAFGLTPAEAGVLRFARGSGFQGEEAARRPPTERALALLRIEEPKDVATEDVVDPTTGARVLRDGAEIGTVSSAAFGPNVEACLAWAVLPPDAVRSGGALEVRTDDGLRAAAVQSATPWDPEGARPRVAFDAADI